MSTPSPTAPSVKLSVLMLAYNHERFIAQALESILMQEVSFEYEIVVGEDCSTDNTRAILLEYRQNHPRRITLLLNETNLGMHKNLTETYQHCNGAYIAMLEGDDYWTDPHKLRKQVDYLDSHPDCSICHHAVLRLDDAGKQAAEIIRPHHKKASSQLKDLLGRKMNFITTCSVIFRNYLINSFPAWYYSTSVGDWPLNILNAMHGDIGYIDEVMSVYRIHDGGIYSLSPPINRIIGSINDFIIINTALNYTYDYLISPSVENGYYRLAREYYKLDVIREAKSAFISTLKYSFHNRFSVPPSHLLKLFLKLYFPHWAAHLRTFTTFH
jgi:glycosyltransferase involved in cell wall biosynthesis